ncbi:MAG: hypothetical protein H7X89_02200 [Rhizobiales bacterium]|nr:hypothetical protein [Hyphomicrobiales bacterium]
MLSDIGGIGIYGVISICLFFTVFCSAVLWAMLLRKPFLNSMSLLPLEDSEANPAAKGDHRHE